jgi:uncharacterized protein with HEPN domain
MPRSVTEYIQHILEEVDYLNRTVQELSKEDFVRNETLKRSFVRSIEIMGEAAKLVPESVRDQYPEIEWRLMAGMRDRLIHGYFGVDYDIVWDVAAHKSTLLAPKLRSVLEKETSSD